MKEVKESTDLIDVLNCFKSLWIPNKLLVGSNSKHPFGVAVLF